MSKKCLLIKTKDKRKFLTHQKNLPSLIEFGKTFSAELYQVVADKPVAILELKPLIAAICNPEYDEDPKFKIINKLFPKSKRNRCSVLSFAKKIRSFIQEQLLAGETVSLKSLKVKFQNMKLTDACLCNHISTIRKTLSTQGHSFEKIGAGKYRLVTK